MKAFLDFWKKDIINKLIVLALLALIGGGVAFGWLVFNMPAGRSLSEAFADVLPGKPAVPTLGIPIVAPTVTKETLYLPTFTPAPLNIQPLTPISAAASPTSALELSPTLVLSPTPSLASPTETSAPVSTDAECVPDHPPKTGKVVEILDGNTVRILIDKLVYVVRYIGVDAPKDKTYADAAKAENLKLVYGKEVALIADVSDKDERGRLLRYVMQGNTFVNLKMIQQGFGSALDAPPDSACARIFAQAEQSASAARIGIWSPTATPKSP